VPLISYQKGKQIGKLVTHRQHRGAWEGGENDFSSLSPHLIDNFHFGSSHRFVVTVVLMCLHTDKQTPANTPEFRVCSWTVVANISANYLRLKINHLGFSCLSAKNTWTKNWQKIKVKIHACIGTYINPVCFKE